MKRSSYIAASVTFAMVLSLSGCKSREKIDLTGIHTQEETTASGKETMASPDAAKPSETAVEIKDAKDESETQKGSDSSLALSVRSKIATEKNGKVSIEYPILSNLKDKNSEETVNGLIKDAATRILTDYEVDSAIDTVSVTCNIVSLDRSKAVLTFEGSLMKNGASYPVNVFYTCTVDLSKEALLGLSDYADPYTMAGYILSDDCVLEKPSDSKEALEYLKTQDINTLWGILKEADFTSGADGRFPESFSYENQGNIYISVPVSHALGDYVIVRFTPDTK